MNSLVDEVNSLCFELIGAVQVSQDKDFSSIFHRQAGAQSILTHDFQSFQSILKDKQDECTMFLSCKVVFTATFQLCKAKKRKCYVKEIKLTNNLH